MKFSKDGHELGMSKVGTVVLGKNAFGQTAEGLRQYFVDILEGRTTEADNSIDTIATVRGNCLEKGVADIAIQELLRIAPKGVTVTLITPEAPYRDKHKRLCASLDFIVAIEGGAIEVPDPSGQMIPLEGSVVLEIKTDGYDPNPPKIEYVLQVQMQMALGDFDHAIIAKLGPKLDFSMYAYERSPSLVEKIEHKVADFWNRVDTNEPYPDPEKPKKRTHILEEAHPRQAMLAEIMESMRELRDQQKALDDIYKERKQQAEDLLDELQLDEALCQGENNEVLKISSQWVETNPKPARWVSAEPSRKSRRTVIAVNHGE
jgi:hypothetical protein